MLLIDNNLSFKLVGLLALAFPNSNHVRFCTGISASDLLVWDYAKKNDFTVLTKDSDFDERSQLLGCPPKVIRLICGNQSTIEILNQMIFRKADIFLFCESDMENCC